MLTNSSFNPNAALDFLCARSQPIGRWGGHLGIAYQMLSSCHFVQTGEKRSSLATGIPFSFFLFPPSFLHPLEHNHPLVFVLCFIFHFCLENNLWPSCVVCFSSFSCKHCLLSTPTPPRFLCFHLFSFLLWYFPQTFSEVHCAFSRVCVRTYLRMRSLFQS